MSSGVTLSVTESDLYQALGDYLRGLFSDAGIERTQQNRVPMPQGDFITMTGIDVTGLSTAVVTYSAPEQAGEGSQHITRTTKWRCSLISMGLMRRITRRRWQRFSGLNFPCSFSGRQVADFPAVLLRSP